MEIAIFTVVGIVLYVVTVQILALLEKMNGNPLPQRNILFFVIIMALSLPTFSVIRTLLGEGESPQYDNQEQQAPNGGDQPAQAH